MKSPSNLDDGLNTLLLFSLPTPLRLKEPRHACCVLSTAGIQASVGLYSSYQANMVALIMVNILAGVALSFKEGLLKHVIVSALSFLTPMIHPYTGVQYFAMLAMALLFSF
ncbi:MAG: hypothetical protein QXU11_08705 [Thermoproteota archaeon]